MESPFAEKAIPMVAVDESTGKYVVTTQAMNFLRAIQGPIAVVSVAGLYRTGKSYLLNRVLLNRSNGFGVGPSVNPCTKGLWCWGTPIKGTSSDGEAVNIIVIDTEGIGALDEDTTHDTKIFTLAILASSCFIYNSVGSIDQNAVQNLSLVVNLTRHIQLKASGQDDDGEDPDEISSYFPSFFWVVRDFSLQLQDPQGNQITSKEYLEKALAPQNGFSDDVEEKNRIRRLLTAFFKDRDCFTMIRPLVDEQKLQNLDKMDYDELRPEFVHQAMSFRKRILSSVKVKSLQNQKLNGELYCSMINSYVGAINDGAVPNIENAWNYMCEEQCRKSLDDCYELFIKEMKEGFRDFPKPEEDFNKCVYEAEEKALEAFREKALGDRSAAVLKELKSRIRTQIGEARDQNIKESNEEIRKYILKQINPIKVKLTNQEYRSYHEFDKEILGLEDRLIKDGPKLHSYKLIYLEAMKKLSTQGAEFLFKNFTKLQEKDREMFKLKEKELQTQLESTTQEKDALRKEHMEFTTGSDQKVSQMSYKLETLTARLSMTSKSKEEEEQKMERQFSAKYHELESNRKAMEGRIRELMERIEENTKSFNLEKKEWQKEMAVLDLKSKQQAIHIEDLSKKEKAESANWSVEKNTMAGQVREITQRHEREKEEMKFGLKDFEEKNNELHDELTSLKEELEAKTEKLEKKEKKIKEEIAARNKDLDRLKHEFEIERKQLKEEFELVKESSSKDSTVIEEKCREAEKALKEVNDRFRKEKHGLESEKELVEQRYELLRTEYETLKMNNSNLKEQYEVTIISMEQTFTSRNEETYSSNITEIKSQYEVEINSVRADFESQRRRLSLELNNFSKKCEEFESQCQSMRLEGAKRSYEFESRIEQLNEEIKHLRSSHRTLEGERTSESEEKESRFKGMIRELENEIEQVKDKASNEKAEQLRQSQESISQIKNGYEMEKENLERRIRNEKDKYERRISGLVTEHERKLEEETEPLLNDIQELNEKIVNLEEMLRNQSTHMQHEIDMNVKRAESLEKAIAELKELHERKEREFNGKYDALHLQSRTEKEKLEAKVEGLTNESNRKDKDLMSAVHARDQLSSTLDKKENKLRELEIEMGSQKEAHSEQIDKLHNKQSIIEKDHHDKMTNYERENALLKQKNEFNVSKIEELEKTIEMTNQVYEEKMARYKEEREAETKATIDKILAEKTSVENKYREYKNTAKDLEASLKRSVTELIKEKQVMEVRVLNLEGKFKDSEQKKAHEIANLQIEVAKYKETYQTLKATSDAESASSRAQLERLENQYNDLVLKFEKEKSLSEQKIAFLTNSKDENKKDAEERIRKLEAQLSQMQNMRSSEKTTYDNYSRQIMANTETKYSERITVLNEEIMKKTSEYESSIKDKEHIIKELREKYETEKLLRETSIAKSEKRMNELAENERRFREEIDRLKADRDRREAESLKREKDDKEAHKGKVSTLESRIKELESDRMKGFFEFQKQKSKWNYEKDTMNENVSNMQDSVRKLQKEKDKFKMEVEKLKAEKKNTRTHSYIGNLKSTYEPSKLYQQEDLNKENNFTQKE